jgi:transcription elongation factor Elf1
MKDSEKPRKKKVYRKPETKTCYYCGSEKIERLAVGGVNIIRCKNCGETQD